MSLETLRWPRSRIIFRHLARVYACQGLCVYHYFPEREREREREEKEKKTASTADRAVGLRYPARSVFIIALSVPQRLIAVPYGENKCTERGGTRGGEERLRGCRPFHSTIILFARFYRRRERKGGTEARDKRRGWTRRNKGTQYIESESCSTIS